MSKPDNAGNKVPVLIVATLSSFLTPFMTSSVNIALPSIGHEFAMNAVQLGWVATAYLLTATIFLVPLGKLADIVGRKRIFTYGILLYTAISALHRSFGFHAHADCPARCSGGGRRDDLRHGHGDAHVRLPPGERGKCPGDQRCRRLHRGFRSVPFWADS